MLILESNLFVYQIMKISSRCLRMINRRHLQPDQNINNHSGFPDFKRIKFYQISTAPRRQLKCVYFFFFMLFEHRFAETRAQFGEICYTYTSRIKLSKT